MRSAHAKRVVVACVFLSFFVLSACTRTVSLSGEEADLPACDTVAEIDVRDLDGVTTPCAPYGSYVIFPDGHRMEVSENVAVSSSGPSPEYTLYYMGTHGLAASFADGDSVEWWSHTEKALELAQYLQG